METTSPTYGCVRSGVCWKDSEGSLACCVRAALPSHLPDQSQMRASHLLLSAVTLHSKTGPSGTGSNSRTMDPSIASSDQQQRAEEGQRSLKCQPKQWAEFSINPELVWVPTVLWLFPQLRRVKRRPHHSQSKKATVTIHGIPRKLLLHPTVVHGNGPLWRQSCKQVIFSFSPG